MDLAFQSSSTHRNFTHTLTNHPPTWHKTNRPRTCRGRFVLWNVPDVTLTGEPQVKVLIGSRHLGTRRAEVPARGLRVKRRQLGLEGRPLLCARQHASETSRNRQFWGCKKYVPAVRAHGPHPNSRHGKDLGALTFNRLGARNREGSESGKGYGRKHGEMTKKSSSQSKMSTVTFPHDGFQM